jgi:hypothetical protein
MMPRIVNGVEMIARIGDTTIRGKTVAARMTAGATTVEIAIETGKGTGIDVGKNGTSVGTGIAMAGTETVSAIEPVTVEVEIGTPIVGKRSGVASGTPASAVEVRLLPHLS